ncbi:MAG: hypothetical protein ACFB4J_04645 [Elainellaceae cyanobacterium]
MKLSFRDTVYESPFSSQDIHAIADLPLQYGTLFSQMSQIPGLQDESAHPQSQAIAIPESLSPITAILVVIWEPAPLNESRIRPFHFVVRYLLSSQQAVFDILNQYHQFYLAQPRSQSPSFFIGVHGSLMRVAAALN